jgi:hypothetical protein
MALAMKTVVHLEEWDSALLSRSPIEDMIETMMIVDQRIASVPFVE